MMDQVDEIDLQILEEEIVRNNIPIEVYEIVDPNSLNGKEKENYNIVKRYLELIRVKNAQMFEENVVDIKNNEGALVSIRDLGLKMLSSLDGRSGFFYYRKEYYVEPQFLHMSELKGNEDEVLTEDLINLMVFSKDREAIRNFDFMISIRESTRTYINKQKMNKNIINDDHLYKNYENIKKKMIFDKCNIDKNFLQYQQNFITDLEILDVQRNLLFFQVFANLSYSEDYRSQIVNKFIQYGTHQVYGGLIIPMVIEDFLLANNKILMTDISITSLPIMLYLMQNNDMYLSCNYSLRKNKKILYFQPFIFKVKNKLILEYKHGFFLVEGKIDDIFLLKKFLFLNIVPDDTILLDKLNLFLKDNEFSDLLDYEMLVIQPTTESTENNKDRQNDKSGHTNEKDEKIAHDV